jgi:hypothetical protein
VGTNPYVSPNIGMESTPSSVRSYVAPAFGRGILPAFGGISLNLVVKACA